jgi:hypothetical protein
MAEIGRRAIRLSDLSTNSKDDAGHEWLWNARSCHGPARTRTWDQSIMSRLL